MTYSGFDTAQAPSPPVWATSHRSQSHSAPSGGLVKRFLCWPARFLLLLVSLALLVGAGAGIAVATGLMKLPTVTIQGSSWGQVTKEDTEVKTIVAVTNPNHFGLAFDEAGLAVKIELNDVPVAESSISGVHIQRGTSTTQVVTTINNRAIPVWWASHVKNGERTIVQVVPSAQASVLGHTVSVDIPEQTREISTDILAGARSSQPHEYPIGPYKLTVEYWTVKWGEVDGDTVPIDCNVVLQQDSPFPVSLSDVKLNLVMNGIAVARGRADSPVVLEPNVETTAHLTATIDNQGLAAWWPTHITNGEHTSYTIDATANLDTPVGAMNVRVLDVHSSFDTDLLGAPPPAQASLYDGFSNEAAR